MPSLTDLPDEVLMNVFRFLDLNTREQSRMTEIAPRRPALCALSLTNRRLSNYARELLWRDVRFEFTRGEPEDAVPHNLNSVHLFLRTCRRNESHLQRVKSASVQWDCADDISDDVESLLRALATSLSLTSLSCLLYIDHTLLSRLPSLIDCWRTTFRGLKTLDIWYLDYGEGAVHDTLPAELLLQWALLPQLTTLQVNASVSGITREDTIPDHGTSRLESLILSGPAHNIHEDALRMILPRAPAINLLDMPPPGEALRYGRRRPPHEMRELAPAMMTAWLLPIRHSVRELSIMHGRGCDVPRHDGSSIDLSEFEQLEAVTLAHYLLPASTSSDTAYVIEPHNLWRCLPPGIRTLTIGFCEPHGILYSKESLYCLLRNEETQEYNPFFSQPGAEDRFNKMWCKTFKTIADIRAKIAWLTELIEKDRKRLPRLRKVQVQDAYHMNSPASRLWDLFKQYPFIVEGAGVEVEVSLDVAKDWKPPVWGFYMEGTG
ncbi:hypothetical protein OHC33_009831 [Knufia fluminis]|uniref:F-box domain-containing protein n=1 Tax=Knufia fluminis TaxID=191047 RepID=A0AAN8EA93_9EURO|nr:hypothetical protein OHC33_009831 [Knufia fluminis]